MTLYVKYIVPDGRYGFPQVELVDSVAEAHAIADANGWEILSIKKNPTKAVTDGTGFSPHYNHGLGMWIETKSQYNAELKARKLIEVGNERIGKTEHQSTTDYFTDDVIRGANEMGLGLTDGDVKMLRDKEAV